MYDINSSPLFGLGNNMLLVILSNQSFHVYKFDLLYQGDPVMTSACV